MDLEQIKEIAELITSNFSNKQKAFLFGSFAHHLENERETFSNPRDLDLLFEIDREISKKYGRSCQDQAFTIFGQPYDPFSMYWEYYSPSIKRWEIVQELFNISGSLVEKIISSLDDRAIDIIILPFDWEEDNEILTTINSRDPKFSQNIRGNRRLLFEK